MNKITINGKEYPCRLTIGVLKRYKDNTGKELEEVKDAFSIAELLFLALQVTCKKQDVAFPYASVEDLMDDLELSELGGITENLFGAFAGTDEKKTGFGELTRSSVLQ